MGPGSKTEDPGSTSGLIQSSAEERGVKIPTTLCSGLRPGDSRDQVPTGPKRRESIRYCCQVDGREVRTRGRVRGSAALSKRWSVLSSFAKYRRWESWTVQKGLSPSSALSHALRCSHGSGIQCVISSQYYLPGTRAVRAHRTSQTLLLLFQFGLQTVAAVECSRPPPSCPRKGTIRMKTFS